MNGISANSYSNGLGFQNQVSNVQPKLGTYELNVKEFGPVVSTVLAAGEALGQTASSVCTFSEQGLNQLENAVKDSAHTVSSYVHSGVAEIESAASAVGNVVSAAADKIGDALDEVGSVASTAAGYVGQAVAAAGNALDLLV